MKTTETMKAMQTTINLTPHEIVLVGETGEVIIRLPSDGVARVATSSESAGEWDGLPLTRSSFGEVEGLPQEIDGTRLIVSRVVAAACPGRADLLVPGQLVRNENGQPIGCRSLEVV